MEIKSTNCLYSIVREGKTEASWYLLDNFWNSSSKSVDAGAINWMGR